MAGQDQIYTPPDVNTAETMSCLSQAFTCPGSLYSGTFEDQMVHETRPERNVKNGPNKHSNA